MNESNDRLLADWLHEGPESGPREGLERALAATRRVGQRPGWTLPERWIPMQLTMARTRSQRPILALVMLALLTVALVAGALYGGSLRLPTSSLYRNGAVVYAADGDLFIADQLDGRPRLLVGGPEIDSDPVFSPQGDRVAFVRDLPGDPAQILTVSVDRSDVTKMAIPPYLLARTCDGSEVTEEAHPIARVSRLDWSPDGATLLASVEGQSYGLACPESDGTMVPTTHLGLRQLVAMRTDGSESRVLGFGAWSASDASWRPGGRHIAFRGGGGTSDAVLFIADADGSNIHRLLTGPMERAQSLEWSPDGSRLSVMGHEPRGAAISIADIDEAGSLTSLRRLELGRELVAASDPAWSPDGSQLAFVRRTGDALRVGIVSADGSGSRLVGPEVYEQRAIDLTWAPDGRSLVVFEHPQNVPDVPVGPYAKAWFVDQVTGEHTEVQTPAWSWQRLAP